eukprot:m.197804 g.197804  ORF g.197804 m.197804 type:complete len:458 (-) comp17027_c0_seq1:75-1448(-)
MPPKAKSAAKRPAGAAKGKKAKMVKRVDVDLTQYDFTTDAMDDAIDAIKGNINPDCGTPLLAGSVNWNVMSSKQKPDPSELLWEPHVLSFFKDIPVRDVAIGVCASTVTFVTKSGHVFTMGRNDQGQLGLGDDTEAKTPLLVDGMAQHKIVQAASGTRHSLLLTSQGTVFACGDNRSAQLGNGNNTSSPVFIPVATDEPIKKVACGGEFSMLLTVSGKVLAFGHPEYMQLGDNADGKFFITASKLSYRWTHHPKEITTWCEKGKDGKAVMVEDVVITDIACGQNHTVVIDSKKRVFTWGFGGYGRLGHSTSKDEGLPRLIALFNHEGQGAVAVAAGSKCCLVVTEAGQLYFWGQIKASGEATMYPKPVYDLSGWTLDCVASGYKHIAVAGESKVITWGPSPCHGELGYGAQKKSSTKPLEVASLDGMQFSKVAAGYAVTVYIAKEGTDLSTLPEWSG